ncbi:MAG: c-type cytochrome [Gammaproteobacteria bacterium]|nr:c-type cytochrome [Gammaproteobacteria bacterium]
MRSTRVNMHGLSLFIVLSFFLTGCGGGAQTEEHPGKNTYRKYCRSCHQGGLAGSPIYGDKEDWQPRIVKGREVLLENTIKGMPPGMPIKGLCSGCTDEELEEAIDYMLEAVEDAPVEGEPE